MKKIIRKHKDLWSTKQWRMSACIALLLLGLSLLVNYYANIYANLLADNHVSDIILDILPVLNMNFIFFQGTFLFYLLVILILVRDPGKIPFVVKSIALFIFIRSLFISMTHLATPPINSLADPANFFLYFTGGNDMFFSGHTGMPFLLALIYWQNKKLRIFFLTVSLVFGFSVLLGHLHYSIDVFAAFFIAYGIYHIALRLFPKDRKLFLNIESNNR